MSPETETVRFQKVNYREHRQHTKSCWIIIIITLLHWSPVPGRGWCRLLLILTTDFILVCHLQSTVHDFLADTLWSPASSYLLDIFFTFNIFCIQRDWLYRNVQVVRVEDVGAKMMSYLSPNLWLGKALSSINNIIAMSKSYFYI